MPYLYNMYNKYVELGIGTF